MGLIKNWKNNTKLQKEMAKMATDNTMEMTGIKSFFRRRGDKVVCTLGELDAIVRKFKKQGLTLEDEVVVFVDKE